MVGLNFPLSASFLANVFGARLVGDPDLEIRELAGLNSATPGSLSFFSNRAYSSSLDKLSKVAVFTRADLVRPELPVTFLVVENPQEAFAKALNSFAKAPDWTGISSLAYVSDSAVLGEGVVVAPFAVIAARAKVGRGTVIFPHVSVGEDVEIGIDCVLRDHVTIYERSVIGNRVKIHSSTVVGSDGFGYFGVGGSSHAEMPQVGKVVIEDDVRIGACCTIDRATLNETRIRRGTKIDDQVHIGHNCDIGEDGLICAQVGLGGSVRTDRDVIMAGQAGVGHGVHIGQGARLGGQTGASTNIPAGESVYLTPSIPLKETMRIVRYWRKLPEIFARVKRLENLVGGARHD